MKNIFCWILHSIVEILCFSANVRQYSQCKFLNLFVFYYISFLPTKVAANSIKHFCDSGWFVEVCAIYTPILTILLKNILRTFEAKMLKILEIIQP